MIIAPSILSADFTKLGVQVKEAEKAGADWIHVDVMDGRFVPNITFGPMIVKAVRRATTLPIDVHLMIVEPEKHLQAFADAGTNHLTVHYETCPHIHRTLENIRELGMSPGIVINPGTPINTLEELPQYFEKVLIMTVNPGFGGQSFIPSMYEKIRKTRDFLKKNGSKAMIQVDGGISPETIKACYQAGADNFIAGSAIFGHQNGIAAGIKALREALK
ncbi:ribulose-phosphate 3-epimerase [Lentilactobacillus sp.]|uniref:ribulose-phosphate 3-epimerase n=1 Tax=Lentilactobacillus sp. TaxID=2767931 RepID=UPI00345EA33C